MRSREQQLAALRVANQRRYAVAQAKRDLRDGKRSLADVLGDPVCSSARVEELLRAQHYWGRRRSADLLAELGIGYTRRVRDLTDRQVGLVTVAAQRQPAQWVAQHRRAA